MKKNWLKRVVLGAVIGGIVTDAITDYLKPLINKCSNYLVGDPIPINKSATEIINWYRSYPNQAQAQASAQEIYYGSYLKVNGKIKSIGVSSNSPQSVVEIEDCCCFMAYDKAALLNVGEESTAIGQIVAITSAGSTIQLTDCRFEGIAESGSLGWIITIWGIGAVIITYDCFQYRRASLSRTLSGIINLLILSVPISVMIIVSILHDSQVNRTATLVIILDAVCIYGLLVIRAKPMLRELDVLLRQPDNGSAIGNSRSSNDSTKAHNNTNVD